MRSFAECDRYNPNDAEDRRMRRAMEAENARFRKQERAKLQQVRAVDDGKKERRIDGLLVKAVATRGKGVLM